MLLNSCINNNGLNFWEQGPQAQNSNGRRKESIRRRKRWRRRTIGRRINVFLRAHVELVMGGFLTSFLLPPLACPVPPPTHTPLLSSRRSPCSGIIYFSLPTKQNSIFLVQLVCKKESNLVEPNHIKMRMTDDHSAFLEVGVFFPPLLKNICYVCFQGDAYQKQSSSLAGHLLLETAPPSSSSFLEFLLSFPWGTPDFLEALIFSYSDSLAGEAGTLMGGGGEVILGREE